MLKLFKPDWIRLKIYALVEIRFDEYVQQKLNAYR